MSTELILHVVEEIPYQLAPLPTQTLRANASLTLHDYARHVARLNAAIKATLRQYWTPAPDEVVDHIEMEDWTEALEDWPVDQIRDVLRFWVMENPRRRPNYGNILEILKRRRGDAWVARRKQMRSASSPTIEEHRRG
ncbi:hypothetical protein LX81_04348 [Palleronia aestuarii]|uniref:Uncharacterized protein n=1 Tax=Palleronia aestuarii TaxID=568105 RepID=A0A2W7MZB9_9RHOB|nr:hypothetical protein [Palleronia aestuarii]PZX09944.1 hypothetical protein LX81_04348 [Palleronia aestuarii]